MIVEGVAPIILCLEEASRLLVLPSI